MIHSDDVDEPTFIKWFIVANPEPDAPGRCHHKVYSWRSSRYHQCSRRGAHTVEGWPLCSQHASKLQRHLKRYRTELNPQELRPRPRP